MNALQGWIDLFRQRSTFTVTAGNRSGWTIDDKAQSITVGPHETTALAQVGVTLPIRAEVAAAALAKQAQAMTPVPAPTPTRPPMTNAHRWFWFGGGVAAGIFLTLLLVRRSA